MENIERQLEEIEVLEAVYPDELTVDAGSIESARQLVRSHRDSSNDDSAGTNQPARISLTIRLEKLTSLGRDGCRKDKSPSIAVEFPPGYPETSPPLVARTSGLDTELLTILRTCLEEHSGEECIMQLITSVNENIQIRNELTEEEYEYTTQQKEREKGTKSQDKGSSIEEPVVLGRRIINSPYILKPAKIKDLKKCADELGLGGYAKVGKPGIIVIEGPEESCREYCPRLEDRGWKYQTVQGEQQETVPPGKSIDDLRILHGSFEILDSKDALSELIRQCRAAGLADLFFSSLGLHDSVGEGNAKKDQKGFDKKEARR